MPIGKSNQKSPTAVWLYKLFTSIRIKYLKSGVMLPITKPVRDRLQNLRFRGKTMAGCANVKGNFIRVRSL